MLNIKEYFKNHGRLGRPAPRRSGFSLIELIVIVAIIGILSGAAYIGIQKVKSKNMNDKVLDDLIAVSNAMEQYKRDHFGSYPIPTAGGNMNLNCFYADATFANDCTSTGGASFIQGMIDNNLLTKRYLQEVPTDPRTSSRYVYGVSTDGKYFQVAGLYEKSDGTWIAKVVGNVAKGFNLPSLIRAFNGPNFVVEDGGNLPYSPDHLAITGTLNNINISAGSDVKVNGSAVSDGMTVQTDDEIETTGTATADIYFSDGSVTHLDGDTKLKIQSGTKVEQNDKDSIITKIRLKLFSGKIWNKVARLAQKSEFNIETTSAIAGVRGTEFGVEITDEDAGTANVLLTAGGICLGDTKECDNGVKITVESDESPVTYDLEGNSATPSSELVELMGSQTKHYLNDNMSPHILGVTGTTATIKNINDYYNIPEGIVISRVAAYSGTNLVGELSVDATHTGDYMLNISTTPAENVKFRFENHSNPNNVLYSGYSTPPITVSNTTQLTEADLYGGVGGVAAADEGGTQPVSCEILLNSPYPDDELTEGYPVHLTWYTMPAGCAGTFDVYLNSKIDVSGQTVTVYPLSTTLETGDYTWQIKSGGIESQIRNFIIVAGAETCVVNETQDRSCLITDATATIGSGTQTRQCTVAGPWPDWDLFPCVATSCNLGYQVVGETCEACSPLPSDTTGNPHYTTGCEWGCNTGYLKDATNNKCKNNCGDEILVGSEQCESNLIGWTDGCDHSTCNCVTGFTPIAGGGCEMPAILTIEEGGKLKVGDSFNYTAKSDGVNITDCVWSAEPTAVGHFSGANQNQNPFIAVEPGYVNITCLSDAAGPVSEEITVLLKAEGTCYGNDLTLDPPGDTAPDDIGYWYGGGCWVLGDLGQACSDPDGTGSSTGACDDIGGLSCVADDPDTTDINEGNWNDCGANGVCPSSAPEPDDCAICKTFYPTASCASDTNTFAPLYLYGTCKYRFVSPVTPSQECVNYAAGKQRICKCQ